MANPYIPEDRRFCAGCYRAVGRSRGDVPGLTEGFCGKCSHPFSFSAKLRRGELVAGQYDVAGPTDHGGLGWIYLARDRKVEDRWVALKGLINRGDAVAMAAALAERQSLAKVEHPNIVKIHNFVEHDGDGYIVMEWVDGLSLSKELDGRRKANDNQPDPLPVELAIEYILEILPAIGHLHDLGLLYCDFKPSNLIPTAAGLKLIDLGGVYRVDDRAGPSTGQPATRPPRSPTRGRQIASDLFTVARTLVVLCTDFRGYRGTYCYTLPPPEDIDLAGANHDSFYRFLERATAEQTRRNASNRRTRWRRSSSGSSGRSSPPRARCTEPRGRALDSRLVQRTHHDARCADPCRCPSSTLTILALLRSCRSVPRSRGCSSRCSTPLPDRSVEADLRSRPGAHRSRSPRGASTVLDTFETRLSEAGDAWDWRIDWYRARPARGRRACGGTGPLHGRVPRPAG